MKPKKQKGGLTNEELVAKYGNDTAVIPFGKMIDVLLSKPGEKAVKKVKG